MSNQGAPHPPGTGGVDDRRKEFERLSRQARENPDSREFIEHKIEVVRTDPNLTDDEKARAIEELRRAFE